MHESCRIANAASESKRKKIEIFTVGSSAYEEAVELVRHTENPDRPDATGHRVSADSSQYSQRREGGVTGRKYLLVVSTVQKVPIGRILCDRVGMRSDVTARLGPGDRERLEAVLADRNSPQKHVWRARIILATAEGCVTTEVIRRAGVSKPCVWRWQRRFMEARVDGLLRDKTRKPGETPVPDPVVARLIERTLGDPRARPRTGPVGRWPVPWAWWSAQSRRSGPPMAWRRTG
jgi:Homeodomain-like domain-containing protein